MWNPRGFKQQTLEGVPHCMVFITLWEVEYEAVPQQLGIERDNDYLPTRVFTPGTGSAGILMLDVLVYRIVRGKNKTFVYLIIYSIAFFYKGHK